MNKTSFSQFAANYNVSVSFSGKQNKAFIKGEDAKVKSFIRICNLKGKGAYPFAIAQG